MRAAEEEIIASALDKSTRYLMDFDPPFEIEVAKCADYSDLLQGNHQDGKPLVHLLEWGRANGRVLLSGRGASGKTTLLHRVVVEAANARIIPFFIPLSKWDNRTTSEWESRAESPREALDLLLRIFSGSGCDISDVEFMAGTLEKVFIIDGLNETPGSVPEEILWACDRMAALLPGCSVIVSDRLIRRNIKDDGRWVFSMPLPVGKAVAERLMKGRQLTAGGAEFLANPFYLNRALHGELNDSPLETIRKFIENHGKLDDVGMDKAAKAAFRAYEIDKSRSFDIARFAEVGGEDAAQTLLAGGILENSGPDRVAFSHHWYHDYLASRFIANRPEAWSSERRHRNLDILTFDANSFDAVAFVLQLLYSDGQAITSFIKAVYDWNPYAAGYALAEAVKLELVPVAIRRVIFGNLAEKRFDRHFQSARRAQDALNLFRDADAVALREAPTLKGLISIVHKYSGDSVDVSWQELFSIPVGTVCSSGTIEALSDEDSVLGWTAANVIKRLRLVKAQEDKIINLGTKQERSVVRWRACHVMGSIPNKRAVGFLLSRVDHDKDDYVRYGAIRSLVEVASRNRIILKRVVSELIRRIDKIRAQPKLLAELSRVVFLSPGCAPPRWTEHISTIFYALIEKSTDMPELEKWSKVVSDLRIHEQSSKIA